MAEGKEIHTFDDGLYIIGIRGDSDPTDMPQITTFSVRVQNDRAILVHEPEDFEPREGKLNCVFYKKYESNPFRYKIPRKSADQIQTILKQVRERNATLFKKWVTRSPELLAKLAPEGGDRGPPQGNGFKAASLYKEISLRF